MLAELSGMAEPGEGRYEGGGEGEGEGGGELDKASVGSRPLER